MQCITFIATLLLLASAAAEARSLRAESQCPPPGLDSVRDFNLQAYIAAPWYAVEQVVVSYQPRDSFFCITARYIPVDPSNLQVTPGPASHQAMHRSEGLLSGSLV
eukprot:GHRQ01014032.1.p1 GENE.GHRQ01014032.1~~GHRQ01014032.1.p1  ORF type:complete len:106 (+),score=25.27 GHRQ01014032.1:118-435(+)